MVTKIHPHPLYLLDSKAYDVAILELAHQINPFQALPICLPFGTNLDKILDNEVSLKVVGASGTQGQLEDATLISLSNEKCNQLHNYTRNGDDIIKDSMLCAHSSTAETCKGDKRLKSKEMQLCRFVLTFVLQYFFVMIVVKIVALAEHCFVYKHAT